MIRVVLPYHLRNLARVDGEVLLEAGEQVTIGSVLDVAVAAPCLPPRRSRPAG